MWVEKTVSPKLENGFAFKPHMIDVYVEAFNNQTFNQDGNESALLIKNITIRLILYSKIYQLERKLKNRS